MKIIAIAGGTATGKSTFAQYLASRLPSAMILPLDRFYLNKPAHVPIEQHNFEAPTAFDFKEFHKALEDLKDELPIQLPKYEYTLGKRTSSTKFIPGRYLIIEGLYSLMHASIRSLLQYSFYLECSADVVMSRYILKNMKERNYTPEYSIQQYFAFVRPSFFSYVAPTRQHAKMVVTNDYNSRLDLFLDDFLAKYQL
ncbi:MAG: uridine kinase [SAR324 cluster bacterium]|nr:uridine kinase [SAR324 cluster bacterium]